MTRRDLTCVHEPFGDAFYFGPERLSERYEGDEKTRLDIGFSESTYKTIMDRFDREAQEVRSNPAMNRFSSISNLANPGEASVSLPSFPLPRFPPMLKTIHITRAFSY